MPREWIDSTSCVLHSNEGYEVEFQVDKYDDGTYHVEAYIDYATYDFLEENYPDDLEKYSELLDTLPSKDSKDLGIINQHVAHHTYNSIRPFMEDENGCLVLDEYEIDKD